MKQQLRISEIFYSLQGESITVGLPTVFVRLTGCPLRCQYCDTEYAFSGGKKWDLANIIAEIQKYNTQYVTVTGGEPLAQPACAELLRELSELGFKVSLETSGAMPISGLDPRVMVVMDLKTPDSKEETKNLYANIEHLKPQDQVKFVICSRVDYEFAKECLHRYKLAEICEVLISPSFNQIKPRELADWILHDQLPVRFQLQLHKLLWADEPGR